MSDARPHPVLYRDTALAEGRSDKLRLGVSLLVEGGRIAWIREAGDEPDTSGIDGLEVIDASGAALVPAMVDAHSHVTMPGGAHWIERVRSDRRDGARRRALSLGLRDRWRERPERPYIRAAGTWVTRAGTLPTGLGAEASTADELLAAAMGQLDDGADLVKLYLDGPDPEVPPWSRDEVGRVVAAAHQRGARVTAHATRLDGTRAGVDGGVDAIEHGFEIDTDLATDMARRGTFLVSTLSVFRSRVTFRRTTAIPRFASDDGARAIVDRLAEASASVAIAHAAGVRIAAGTDFGGGSPRAGELAWEVESLVASGLEPWEALAAATWRGGELLGEPEAGVVREGGPADFFLVHGDPLSEPAALWRVWRVGWTP